MGELKTPFADKEDFLDGKEILVSRCVETKGSFGDEVHLYYEDGESEYIVSLWHSAIRKYCKEKLCRRNFSSKDFEQKIFRIKTTILSTDATGKKKMAWMPIEYVRDFAPVEQVV